MKAIYITGYLAPTITNSKHRSAREAIKLVKSVLKESAVSGERIEVFVGQIFITFKDEAGIEPLKEALKGVEGVEITEPSAAQLVFLKERARAEAESAASVK